MSRGSKKRKRKPANPLKVILIICSVLLAVLVVCLFSVKMAVQGWLQGPGFQSWIRAKASEALHSDVEIAEMKWSGMKAFVGEVKAHGYEEAAFARADVDAIRTSFGGLRDGAFRIDDINISQATVEFSDERRKAPSRPEIVVEETAKEPPGMPGWLKKWAPNRVEIDRITIGSATIDVKDETGASPVIVRGTRATLVPKLETGALEIKAGGGRLVVAGLPEMDIRSSSLRFQNETLFINNAALGIYNTGHVSGLGEILFGEPVVMDLELNLSGIDAKEVVSEDWVKRVSGTVRGLVNVKGDPENLDLSGTLYLDDGVLEAVPILEKIALVTNVKRFNRLVLNQAQADFRYRGDTIELRNIQLESDGLTRLEGNLDKRGELMKGVLQVGVTPGTLRWIPGNAGQTLFTESRDGFLWTTVELDGTTSELTDRLITAAGVKIMADAPESAIKVLESLLRQSGSGVNDGTGTGRRPDGGTVIEQGSRILRDVLTPFLGR